MKSLQANAFEGTALGRNMSAEKMSIAGEWCEAEDGATADILNPASSEVIATTPKATLGDVQRCVDASRAAFEDASWKAMDPAQRGRILNKMAQATYAKAKELAVIESNNNGKTFREALSEIRYGAWTLEYFAGFSDKIEGSTIPVPGNRLNYTLRQPLGVTVHIVPWNFPLQLAIRSIAPALAAGCTVIAKPASWTPLSLLAWAKAMEEAEVGLPSGVLQVITGSGGLIGDALAGHKGVDGIVLTGGVPTGQTVMAKASENLTPVTLELGGKGANIVFSDANLRYAAKAICFGIFMNAGQMCWAGSRLIVHEDVHDELVEAVVAEVSKWKVGPGMAEGVRIGSLVHQQHRDEVMEKLKAGLAMGGEIVCGGNIVEGEGAFMEATVVTGVDRENLLFHEELFGPVLSVTKFSEDAEALELANDSPFGLLNGIWTQNLSRAHTMAREVESGMVSINEYPITFPQTAFTGWKQSGIGVEQSQDAMRFYTKVKNVNLKLCGVEMSVSYSDMEHGVRLIRFSGQSATQSFSREFLPQIAKAIDAGLSNSEVRAIVLTGEGKFFSAGADINAFAKSIDDNDAPQLIRDLTGVLHPLLVRMRQSSTISIAAINGACAGGGFPLGAFEFCCAPLVWGVGLLG